MGSTIIRNLQIYVLLIIIMQFFLFILLFQQSCFYIKFCVRYQLMVTLDVYIKIDIAVFFRSIKLYFNEQKDVHKYKRHKKGIQLFCLTLNFATDVTAGMIVLRI